MSSNTKTRRHLFFVGLTIAVLAVFLTQHFSAPESSVGRKIERPTRAKKPRVLADQALPATIPSADLPVASATAPSPEPMPAPVQLAREEISTALVAFKKWAEVYAVAPTDKKPELAAKGLPLAEARGHAIAALIKQDPQAAIEALLPYPLRKALPPEIAARIEHRVSGVADLEVIGVTPLPGQVVAEPIYRTVKLADHKYRAYVYGSRKNDGSREQARILGVAVKPATTEALLAIREDAYEVLDPTEAADLDPDRKQTNCPVSKDPTASRKDEIAVDIVDKILWLCSSAHFPEWLKTPDGKTVAAAGGRGGGMGGVSENLPAEWTNGHKKFLMIRVRFTDQTDGDLVSENVLRTGLSKVVENLPKWSYGKMTASYECTPIVALDHDKQYYANLESSNQFTMLEEARAKAAQITDSSGGHPYDTANFQFDGAIYNAAWGIYSGLGRVGGKGIYVKEGGAGLMLHEWGHNFGLQHANGWRPITESPIGGGIAEGYVNQFSTMGITANVGSYTTQERIALKWLQPDNATTVTDSGTYKIYNPDIDNLIQGRRYALKLRKFEMDYHIEYRPSWSRTNNPMSTTFGTDNGAMFILHYDQLLLDMTPSSKDEFKDPALLIGHSFHDPNYEVTVTPLTRGGTAPENYLEVRVNFNDPLTNSAPVAAVTASNDSPTVGSSVSLTATASDPDGDTLAYAWDFGDGSNMSADNSPTQTKSWSSAGTYNVRCTVSDMKGKTFVKSILIRVGTPSTFTISGRVTKPDGTPVQNVLVNEGTIARLAKDPYALYSAYTDADGYYSIGPLPNANGGYKIYAVRDGWQISALSSMPVIVTNNVVNCNFKATQSTEQRGLTLEHWSNIAGNTVEDLIPHLSETPSFSRVLTRFFEVAPDFADNYGQRMKGYFIPPTTGAYTFYLSSNEQSQLYLSTNNLAENKRPIANVVSANYYPHYWRWGPSQKSAAIFLTAGERYYIEALHKEGANRDHFSVGADFPGDIEQFPIHAAYLRPMSSPVISPPITATTVTLAATDPLAKEGTTDTGTFTVTRSGSLANALPVFFSNTGTATYAADYFPTGLSVVIPAGASSAKIIINPVDDTLSEPDETATLQLAPAVTYTLGLVTKGTVTILDNELPEINIVATQPIMTESGEETATFTFIRTGSPAMAISTNFAISGTADRGVDYLNLPNTVTIPAGQTSASVTITAIADTSEEPQETIIFSLLPGSGYVTKLPLTATGYILAQPLLIKWKLAENGNWTDSSKWLTDRPTAGGSIAYELNFNATGSSYSSINDLGNNYRLNKLNFGGAAASLSGGSLRWVANLSGNPILNQNDGNTVSISNELILTTAFTVGGSGNGAVNLTGYISGAGSLNKTHSGRLYLSTNNSYTGGTTVRRGSIDISEPQKTALGMGTIILESGTSLTLNRNIMENELILKAAQLNSYNGYGDQWLGNIILTDVSTIDLSNTGNFTISGNIYGTGGLKKIGISSRALTLSGISTYTGPTIVDAGALACSRPESLAQGTLRINSGAKLELNFNTTRQVRALQLNSDTFQPNGIYGSVASGATYQNDAYFSGTGTITVGPLSATPFASWATAQGLSGANNITQMADPDRDGICNLLEFTLGSSPVAASVATVPKLKINNDGPMTFEYDRNDASLLSVTGVVEYGNDLIGWTVIPIPLTSSTQVTITDGPLKDHVVVSIPNNDDHVFVRLRVSQ